MKKMKKLLSLVLSVAMIVAMGVTVFADEAPTYTLTIDNEKSGHTYEAYQVFAGDLSKNTLSNVQWGTGVNGEALLTELKTNDNLKSDFENCTDAKSVAEKLATFENKFTKLDAFAKIVAKHINKTATGTSNYNKSAKNYTISGLAAGYYFVKDATTVSGTDAQTKFIVQLLGNKEVIPKSSVPTVEKKVKETNDTTGSVTNWQDAADYDIGDNVPFQLTGTMPSTLADYSTYSYTFTDTLSAGLTRNDDVKVYLVNKEQDRREITNSFTISNVDNEKNTFTVSCTNVNGIEGVTAASKIVVEYTARLNEKAVIGDTGNPNKVDLTFSNNPNGDGTGKTPEDQVIVFTYKLVANKVDKDGQALEGAGFTLYKFDKKANEYVAVGEENKGTDENPQTTFEFNRLDAGKYKLVETTVPAGYNKADDIEFTVEATYEATLDENGVKSTEAPTLTGLIIKDATEKKISEGEGAVFTVNLTSGSASTDVVNVSGSILPSTGGIGTTIFYVIGGILMIGAGVLLVSKKRTDK